MNENSGDLGGFAALELKILLERIKSSADNPSASAVKRIIDDVLSHTDIQVKKFVDDSLSSKPGVATVETLLLMRSDNLEVQTLVSSFQRELLYKLSALFTKGNADEDEKRVEYTDEDIDTFVRGTMGLIERRAFVKQLQDDSTLRKRCIRWRENLSELDVSISAEAAEAFNNGTSKLDEGNHYFPGHRYVGQRANETHFVKGREYCYETAKASFEKLIALGELEDLGIANLAIVDANVNNAPIAARFYPASGYDHGEALMREVRAGKSPAEAVFGERPVPSDKKGDVPPTWREGIPLRMKPDRSPKQELLSLDVTNATQARRLMRRLSEFCVKRYDVLQLQETLEREEDLLTLVHDNPEFLHYLQRFITSPKEGGTETQIGNQMQSKLVANRILYAEYQRSGDEKILEFLFQRLDTFLHNNRENHPSGWDWSEFSGLLELAFHFADTNDKVWNKLREKISVEWNEGRYGFHADERREHDDRFHDDFIEPFKLLQTRLKDHAEARKFVVDHLIQNTNPDVRDSGMQVLSSFPISEAVAMCLLYADIAHEQDSDVRKSALDVLNGCDPKELLTCRPTLGSDMVKVFERFIAAYKKAKDDGKLVDNLKGNRDQFRNDEGSRYQLRTLDLLAKLDRDSLEQGVGLVLDHETFGEGWHGEESLKVLRLARANELLSKRDQLIFDYAGNPARDESGYELAELRAWGVIDAELAPAFLKSGREVQKADPDRLKYWLTSAYDYIVATLPQHKEEREEDDDKLKTGEPSDWVTAVEFGAEAGDERFIELLLLEPYRHLLTPERIQNMVDTYVKQTLAENEYGLRHSDAKNTKLSNALTACAYLPNARKHLIASMEQEIRTYNPPEETRKNYQYRRLLYFVWEIYNNARAVEEKEQEGQISSPASSWLFLCRAFQPPREIMQFVFEYCLNDKTRTSVDLTSSFDSYNQMEAIHYVDTIYRLMNGKHRTETDEETPPISLQALETYIVNLVIGRKLPLEAVIAGYCSSLGTVGWRKTGTSRKSDTELLQDMRYPDLGLTSGGMNHRGPTFAALAKRFSELYSHVQPRQKNLVFGPEEGQDPDLDITFFVSALLRIRKFKEAMEVYRDHPLENRQLYAKIARFASMGACEAEEDGNLETALEGFIALQEIVADVPDDMSLEEMSKDEFRADINTHVQELEKRLLEKQKKDGTDS